VAVRKPVVNQQSERLRAADRQ